MGIYDEYCVNSMTVNSSDQGTLFDSQIPDLLQVRLEFLALSERFLKGNGND